MERGLKWENEDHIVAVMVSSALYSLVCVVCVVLLPAVWADDCSSYRDADGYYHDSQQCLSPEFCCGNCNQKFCCTEKKYSLTQESCPGSMSGYAKKTSTAVILGSIFGSIFLIILCIVIVCCVAPCCLFYKKCRKGRSQRHQIVDVRNTTTAVYAPQQPLSPSGHQPSYPGYQPVPVQRGYGGYEGPPIPTAPPPSYMEATDPALSPVAFSPGYPMALFPNQPYAPSTHLDELAQPPYNPSYCLN
ncbi:protein shisa-5-like [Pempheris klunzingeri]|uniref:protein shisa-5-like n=1 Tax=Pempheris klunzingeri TaxID=3127111 RepID=UPI00397EE5F4